MTNTTCEIKVKGVFRLSQGLVKKEQICSRRQGYHESQNMLPLTVLHFLVMLPHVYS